MMHNHNFKIVVLLVIIGPIICYAQSQMSKLSIDQISFTKWNSYDGVLYKQVPGVNLGATSFEILNNNQVAFLSNSNNEIVIVDNSTGGLINKFNISLAPRDFVYDNGYFYVLTENQVILYDERGREWKNFNLPNTSMGIERLTRFDNQTYLLLPSGNSLLIEANGYLVNPIEKEGWITNTGTLAHTQITGNNSYLIKLNTPDGYSYSKIYYTDKKVAGVFVVGATLNKVVLDVQTFISESPISVERNIIEVELNNYGLGSITSQTKVPDCYYVLSNKDFLLKQDGNLYNMITAPQGIYVFSLADGKQLYKSSNSQSYPSYINGTKYHFNDNLMRLEEK